MSGMTFVQLQNAVLANAFDETKRDDAKSWINARHAQVVDQAEWNFRYATDAVTVTAGSNDVSGVATDLGIVLSLQRDDGVVLAPIEDYRMWAEWYVDPEFPPQGRPEAFTVLNGAIKIGPAADETSSTYQLSYQKIATEMTADSDVPIIPWAYHRSLVQAAKAQGMRELGIPLWGEFEEEWARAIASMERTYLTTVRAGGEPFSGQFIPGRA